MTESTFWFKSQLDAMVKDLIKIGAITGAAVEASVVWDLKDKLFISRVWDASNKNMFIWAIAGESAVMDFIPGNLATTPQEVARHFSYKWQMDADRLLEMSKTRSPVANSQEIIEAHSKKMVEAAELLYDLASRDDFWK